MANDLLRRLLHELSVFEVAGRSGSFSAAGRELGMTQSAVSHHMANLETALELILFDRVWRGVTLTPEARVLHEAVRRGLDAMAAGLDEVRRAADRRHLTVLTDFGFAAFYLMPRLDALRQTMPDVDIHLITTQDIEGADLSAVDAAILFGAVAPPGAEVLRLVDERVIAVASPALAPISAPDDLRQRTLLHLDVPRGGHWSSWADHARRLGVSGRRRAPDLTFNNYQFVIQAAIAGQGVALGWRPLVDDLIAKRLLVPVLGEVHIAVRGYDFLSFPDRPRNAALGLFRDWLVADIGQDWLVAGTKTRLKE